MIVRTFDGLQALTTPQPSWTQPSGSLSLYGLNQAYAEIYRTQPNVRICVDFIARNVAQLSPHLFRRVSDTDRVRLADHDLARWLTKPNPATTRYRLIEDLMTDLGIYFRAYWVKVRYRDETNRPAVGFVRLPPEEVTVEGGLLPTQFCWTVNGRERVFAPSEIVHFCGYKFGISPLETLRRILAEETAAGEQREAYWRNSNRMEGVIVQTKDAPTYTGPQQQAFREQLREFRERGTKAGEMALLPKGMEPKPWSFSPKDSEYISGGKLRREVCAAEYHIPQPMVGILDHATFSNIKEQHKHLYQDTLGPPLEMIQQELERQALIECDDQDGVYIEFNIAAKLAGTPEEQIDALVRATGKPIMKVNEARARVNLPRDDDPASDTIAPQQGGPSDATAQPAADATSAPAATDTPGDDTTARTAAVLQATRERQLVRLAKIPIDARATALFADMERWQRELAEDLTPLIGADEASAQAMRANVALLTELSRLEAGA